jgi:hypothetical protein
MPRHLQVPENFIYEKMIHDIAEYYHLDPKEVEKKWDEYDYYEFLVFKVMEIKRDEYLMNLAREDRRKI